VIHDNHLSAHAVLCVYVKVFSVYIKKLKRHRFAFVSATDPNKGRKRAESIVCYYKFCGERSRIESV
jgi:hypothetical protein